METWKIAEIRAMARDVAVLTIERVQTEPARLAFSNVGRLFNGHGSLKPVHELDDDTRAAIELYEVKESVVDGVMKGRSPCFSPVVSGMRIDTGTASVGAMSESSSSVAMSAPPKLRLASSHLAGGISRTTIPWALRVHTTIVVRGNRSNSILSTAAHWDRLN
jgi:hypothetical protein